MAAFKQRFAKGEVIIQQGKSGDRSFRILSGDVLICKENEQQELVPLTVLSPGEVFGEMYLFDSQGSRNATAIASGEVLVEVLFRDEMVQQLHPLSSAQQMIVEGLCSRLVKTSEEVVKQRSAPARLNLPKPSVHGNKVSAEGPPADSE